MRIVLAAMLLIGSTPLLAQTPAPKPTIGSISYQTIYTDGKQILMAQQMPIPGKTIQETYTVRIPVKTPNGVEYREETRVRQRAAMKEERVPVPPVFGFSTVDGKAVTRETLISQLPETGKLVIFQPSPTPLEEEVKQLLKSDALIMQFDPALIEPALR